MDNRSRQQPVTAAAARDRPAAGEDCSGNPIEVRTATNRTQEFSRSQSVGRAAANVKAIAPCEPQPLREREFELRARGSRRRFSLMKPEETGTLAAGGCWSWPGGFRRSLHHSGRLRFI